MTDTSNTEPTPTADQLWSAFFAGNAALIDPYKARPSELTNGLRNVWLTAITDYLALERQLDELAEALTELIACKDLKDSIDGGKFFIGHDPYRSVNDAGTEYKLRKPLAWEAARKALARIDGEPK